MTTLARKFCTSTSLYAANDNYRADAEDGNYYNYFRDYDPTMGRYLQTDIIGQNGGLNLYKYAESNPLKRIDPFGLRPLTESEKNYLRPYIQERDLNNADIHVGDMPVYAPSWAWGITRGNDIYFRNPDQTFYTPEDLGLLGHELVHVGQYADGMDWLLYLWESRNGYENNPYETDPRVIEKKIKDELEQKYGTSCPEK